MRKGGGQVPPDRTVRICRFDPVEQNPLTEPLDLTVLSQLNGPHDPHDPHEPFIPFILPWGGGVGVCVCVCGSAGRRDRVLETSTRSEAGSQAGIASIVMING